MPKAGAGHTTPDPDAALLALAGEHRTISTTLTAWDAEEIDLTDATGDDLLARWWTATDAIAAIRATTFDGRMAKLRCAYAACRGVREACARRLALISSALADVVAVLDDPDARLHVICRDFHDTAEYLRAGAAGEVAMTAADHDAMLASFMAAAGDIAATPAITAAGRRAKLEVAIAAMTGVGETAGRRLELIRVILADADDDITTVVAARPDLRSGDGRGVMRSDDAFYRLGQQLGANPTPEGFCLGQHPPTARRGPPSVRGPDEARRPAQGGREVSGKGTPPDLTST
jgi:hypothetical protein